jgi:predicted NUDIX family NTP pyrophosphohydrolase
VTESAGTLLYRRRGDQMEVLIVHPSGRYNRGAPWSIPKGKTEPGEDAETAARRETQEETGVSAGLLHSIGSVDLARSRKRIYGFAGPAPEDAAPHCASWEVDRARFVTLERARLLLHPAQAPFVDRMLATLDQDHDQEQAQD